MSCAPWHHSAAYAYAVQDERLFVNLYAEGDGRAAVQGQNVKIQQKTDYPWSGAVKLTLQPDKPGNFALCLRIPGWVLGKPLPGDLYHYDDPTPAAWSIKVNGVAAATDPVNGYAVITREWKSGDVVELDLPMPVRRVAGNPKIAATRGQVALERGPVVYAFEGIDNDGAVFDVALPATAEAKTGITSADLLGGVTVLKITGAKRVLRMEGGGSKEQDAAMTAIPYASWNNRGLSPMTVWLGRDAAARPPGTGTHGGIQGKDQRFIRPRRHGQGPHQRSAGAAQRHRRLRVRASTSGRTRAARNGSPMEFEKPLLVNSVTVSWFDDTGVGECRLPKSWKLFYQDSSGAWQPADGAPDYAIRKTEPVKVKIEPVTTKALRIELELADDFSAGLYEWEVD